MHAIKRASISRLLGLLPLFQALTSLISLFYYQTILFDRLIHEFCMSFCHLLVGKIIIHSLLWKGLACGTQIMLNNEDANQTHAGKRYELRKHCSLAKNILDVMKRMIFTLFLFTVTGPQTQNWSKLHNVHLEKTWFMTIKYILK